MNRRTGWKAAERRIASELGGVRVPVSGRSRGDAPDVQHDRLSIEVKARSRLPTWLRIGMQQAVAAARADQEPVVIAHQSGDRYSDAYVVVRLRDLDRLGLVGQAEEQVEHGPNW